MIKHNLPPGDYVGISKAGTTVAVVITEGGFWAHEFRSKLQVELDDIASIMPARPEARNDTAGDEANIALTEHMEESGQDPPEPKPLLADAKVGDLCKTDLDEWIQIDDAPEPPSPILYHLDRPFKGNIIHTEPLADEGSAEWAWQMLKLGKPVTNKWVFTAGGYIKDTDSDKYRFVQMWDLFSDWKLYEPQPEPAKEPEIVAHKQHANCLVCGKVIEGLLDGHATVSIKRYSISSLYESTYSHYCGKCFLELGFDATERELRNRQQPIAEPAKEQFEVGDWVEFRDIEGIKHGIIEGRGEEYSVLFNGVSQSVGDKFITRKLNPSEIVLDFGNGIRGTIRRCRGEQIRIYDGDINFACLAISCVTEPMQTTVRKLLVAIEKERKKQ